MTGPTGLELRHLPQPRPRWEHEADIVVVGSGAAGMTAALAAARHGRRVLLLTKEEDLGGGATPLAQAPPARADLDLATVEATNLHAVSVLVAASARARAESRGCHRWRHAPPVTSAGRARHTVLRAGAAP